MTGPLLEIGANVADPIGASIICGAAIGGGSSCVDAAAPSGSASPSARRRVAEAAKLRLRRQLLKQLMRGRRTVGWDQAGHRLRFQTAPAPRTSLPPGSLVPFLRFGILFASA